jgi:hypothetical protein
MLELVPERLQRRVAADPGKGVGGALAEPVGLVAEQRPQRRYDRGVTEKAERGHRLAPDDPLRVVEERDELGYGGPDVHRRAPHRGPGLAVVPGVGERGEQRFLQSGVGEDGGLVHRPRIQRPVELPVVADEDVQRGDG